MNTLQVKNYEKFEHSWWRKIKLTYVPGPETALVKEFSEKLLEKFKDAGHTVYDQPEHDIEVIITTANFFEPLRWRDAMIFNARRKYNLDHSPTIYTIIQVKPEILQEKLTYFDQVLKKVPQNPNDYVLPGLGPDAYHTLYEQGKRGGPILALQRTIQTQSMSVRVLLVVGDDHPEYAYVFDLVGAHPRVEASGDEGFYDDLVGRMVTAMSTFEITEHQVVGELIPRQKWDSLKTPDAMQRAGHELGKRQFFTEMVLVTNMVSVPSVPDSISSQYSEGCFATWDPEIEGLITTVTGSARPIAKDELSDDELAIIVGVRPDGRGALIRHVENKRNDPPSSEAVELIDLDKGLPRIEIENGYQVPVARSKLHGHRGVSAYNAEKIEHVFLEQPYYHYPVSCSTEAQANAIQKAFSTSKALQNPDDPRQLVFTILPGHGIVIAEKWAAEKEPFQLMWEYMDAGWLVIDNMVPQGVLTFESKENGMMYLQIE